MKLWKTIFKNSLFIKILVAELIIIGVFLCSLQDSFEKDLLPNAFSVAGEEGDSDKTEFLADGSLKVNGDGSDLAIECNDISIPAGRYAICIEYTGDDIQYKKDSVCIISRTNGILLSWDIADWRESITREVYVAKDGGDIRLEIDYSGNGSFILHRVSIHKLGRLYRLLTLLSILLIINAFCIIFVLKLPGYTDTPKWKTLRIIVAVLGGVILFTSIPLFMDSIPDGDDLEFHLTRICCIAEEFGHKQFPVRIYHSINDGQGYPCSIFYGDILLYIPALLLCCGVPVFRAYQIYLLLINVLTAILSYVSNKRIFDSTRAGLIGAAIYCCAPYRIINLYFRAAVGEFSAQAFIPLLICGAYLLIKKEKSESRPWLWICAGATGLIQTHILTTQMCCTIWALFMIIFVKKLLDKWVVVQLFKAAVTTVLINLWFLLPFLRYYLTAGIIGGGMEQLQPIGLYPLQVFSIFMTEQGKTIRQGVRGEMPMSVGAAILLGGIIFAALILQGKCKDSAYKRIAVGTGILGGISLLMSTVYFPWDIMMAISGTIARFTHAIQFTFRYLCPATALLSVFTATAAELALEQKDSIEWHTIVISLFTAALLIPVSHFYTGFLDTASSQYVYTSPSISDRLYLPEGTNTSLFSHTYLSSDEALEYTVLEECGTTGQTVISCENPLNTDIVLTLPITWYESYRVYYDDAAVAPAGIGDNMNLTVTVPPMYKGNIRVAFAEPVLWRICELISIVSLCVTLVLMSPLHRKIRLK